MSFKVFQANDLKCYEKGTSLKEHYVCMSNRRFVSLLDASLKLHSLVSPDMTLHRQLGSGTNRQINRLI